MRLGMFTGVSHRRPCFTQKRGSATRFYHDRPPRFVNLIQHIGHLLSPAFGGRPLFQVS